MNSTYVKSFETYISGKYGYFTNKLSNDKQVKGARERVFNVIGKTYNIENKQNSFAITKYSEDESVSNDFVDSILMLFKTFIGGEVEFNKLINGFEEYYCKLNIFKNLISGDNMYVKSLSPKTALNNLLNILQLFSVGYQRIDEENEIRFYSIDSSFA